jgi:uncharacterized lipoprotein YddW (UPF0748 family)
MNRKDFLQQTALAGLGFVGGLTLQNSFFRQNPGSDTAKNWAWVTDTGGSTDEWKSRLGKLKSSGIDAILPSGNFESIIPAAQEMDIEVHAWKVCLQRGGDAWAHENHPEWFMLNRKGESSLDKPAYVDYYKWLCPSREPVHEYVLNEVDELLQYAELKSIHLDYIRYPDVILPVALQPKYGIEQDQEYPQYDYCYCEVCRAKFEDQQGIDPLDIKKPAKHQAWLEYRYDQVTTLVNKIALKVHAQNKDLTAAVFPTPDIARSLVRQNWPDWDLDALLPMQYNNFYNKGVSWIAEAARQCRVELPATTPVYSGLYIPEMDENQLTKAYENAMTGGAAGVSLFTDTAMSEGHWTAFNNIIKKE